MSRGFYKDEFCEKCRAKGSAGCHPGATHLVETRVRSTTHTDAWGNSYTVKGEPERTWAVFDGHISPHCKHPDHLKSEALLQEALVKVCKLNEGAIARLRAIHEQHKDT